MFFFSHLHDFIVNYFCCKTCCLENWEYSVPRRIRSGRIIKAVRVESFYAKSVPIALCWCNIILHPFIDQGVSFWTLKVIIVTVLVQQYIRTTDLCQIQTFWLCFYIFRPVKFSIAFRKAFIQKAKFECLLLCAT